VANAISGATIGQILIEARTTVRAGCLKLAGVLIQRDDYPQLWTYAQTCGALVSEDEWPDHPGCFSTGDGETTFRIPEVRGEHLRFWDDGRGMDPGRRLGTWQDSQNRAHAHAASSSVEGDHVHGAWTEAQGWHEHGGTTQWAGEHNHDLGNDYAGSTLGRAFPMAISDFGTGRRYYTNHSGNHIHGINGDGQHHHGVSMHGAGAHSHQITINKDGGMEARPCNIALLAMIRAY
jgi:phage-related tail fiber protein